MRALIALLLIAPSLAAADPDPGDAALAAGRALRDAITAKDAAAVAALLQSPVRYEGLPLTDESCHRAFNTHGTVRTKQLPAFAACLVGVPSLVASRIIAGVDHPAAKPVDDGEVALQLWVAPKGRHGIERIAWIDGEVPGGAAAAGSGSGSVTDSVVPEPPAKPEVLPPKVVKARRIRGQDSVMPDDETKTAIQQSGKTRVIASVKICFAVDGKAERAVVVKSSGYPSWDEALRTLLLAWQIKPFKIGGEAVAVCTVMTFIYQHN
jgi:hypothetical protein